MFTYLAASATALSSATSTKKAGPGATGVSTWEAIRATTAAPVLFEAPILAGRRLADGALVANNPAIFALGEATVLWPDAEVSLLVSVGTGIAVPKPYAPSHAIGWVSHAFTMLIATHVEHLQARSLLPEAAYVRIDPEGVGHISPSEWRVSVLDEGKLVVAAWLDANKELIDGARARIAAEAPP